MEVKAMVKKLLDQVCHYTNSFSQDLGCKSIRSGGAKIAKKAILAPQYTKNTHNIKDIILKKNFNS